MRRLFEIAKGENARGTTSVLAHSGPALFTRGRSVGVAAARQNHQGVIRHRPVTRALAPKSDQAICLPLPRSRIRS